jgi:thiol-disulfide isomerase/thioredoxin
MEPSRNLNRRIWLIAIGLLAAWIGYFQFFGQRDVPVAAYLPPDLEDPGLGEANWDWQFQTVDGKPVDFQSYQGKPILLNFWATWCPPCVGEIPSIERLATNARLKGVSFLAVSSEDADTVRRFVRHGHQDLPAYYATSPPPPVFRSEAIPATFIIAPSGHIVARQVGSAQWDDPSVVEFLEKLAR